jgi:glucose-like phosphotransferase system IIB component
MHVFSIAIGTTFSCGLIDFTLYGLLQGNAKTNWIAIIPIYIIYAVGYFFIFKFLIGKFDIKTPGREESEENVKLYSKEDFKNKGPKSDVDSKSRLILDGIGGLSNLIDVDACATRLRLTVEDIDEVKDEILKASGAKGIIKSGDGLQVIYGPEVSIIKSNFEEYIESISK